MGSKFIIILIILLLSVRISRAEDTIVRKDSIRIYKKIETFSKHTKFSKFMYDLMFKSFASTTTNKNVSAVYVQKSYAPFEGKIIRNINIETLDPFGYSLSDSTAQPTNALLKTGNNWHVKSRGSTIRNLLIVRQNQHFDSLKVKESERLVRSQEYVHEVSFFVKPVYGSRDSVDIYIRELDNWSIEPNVPSTGTLYAISLTDKNFLGLGHQYDNGFSWYSNKGQFAYNTNYYIPNIRNTYINSTIHYGTDQFGNFTKSIGIDRPFFSPLARWAMGASVSTQFKIDSTKNINGDYVPLHYKFSTQDYWAGKAFRIFKGNLEGERVTNLILTARYLRIGYIEKPLALYDPFHIYSSEDFYFAGIGISTRKYIKDEYIFNFGIIEDVPVGKAYALTGGYQIKYGIGRYYLDGRISYGNYRPWGYWSATWEYSTFFNKSQAEQGEIAASINYFSPLFTIGKWKIRQFVKPQATFGFNRLPYDSLTLNKGYGIEGFNSRALRGIERMVLTLQTQSYAPWNLIGFNFGPYLIYSIGILGDDITGFRHHKVYSQLGIGVQVRNERLVFNTFQFSLSFYPLIPGKGYNIFKLNSLKTTDFGFKDFDIGKPTTLTFQ